MDKVLKSKIVKPNNEIKQDKPQDSVKSVQHIKLKSIPSIQKQNHLSLKNYTKVKNVTLPHSEPSKASISKNSTLNATALSQNIIQKMILKATNSKNVSKNSEELKIKASNTTYLNKTVFAVGDGTNHITMLGH